MAKITVVNRCPTVEAADRALEGRQNDRPRPYLGMSALGDECTRKLWLQFRWVAKVRSDAASLKRFADGHIGEEVQAERLRLVPGVSLYTHDTETGNQFGFEDLDGHLRGHMDGAIIGLLQAPKTWHCWEHKQTSEKKQADLQKLIDKLGEKNALAAWNATYYAQALLYMQYSGMDRHYMTVASAGGRNTIALRTEADPQAAAALVEKARSVIFSSTPPARISNTPDFYLCRSFCSFVGQCFGTDAPERNCRSCMHSTPTVQGMWLCEKHGNTLDLDEQRRGCPDQRLLPALVPGEQIDATEDTVTYRMPDGSEWVDDGP